MRLLGVDRQGAREKKECKTIDDVIPCSILAAKEQWKRREKTKKSASKSGKQVCAIFRRELARRRLEKKGMHGDDGT